MPLLGSRRARRAAPGRGGRPGPRTPPRRAGRRRGSAPGAGWSCGPPPARYPPAASSVPPAREAALPRDDERHHDGSHGGGEQALHGGRPEVDRGAHGQCGQHPHALDHRRGAQGDDGDARRGDGTLEARPARERAGDGVGEGLDAEVGRPGRDEVEQPAGGQADGRPRHGAAQQRPGHDEHEHDVRHDRDVTRPQGHDEQHRRQHRQAPEQAGHRGAHPVPVATGRGAVRPEVSTTATTSSEVVSTAGVTVPEGASCPTPRCTEVTVPTGRPGTNGRPPTLPRVVTTSPVVAVPRSTSANESIPGAGRGPPDTAAPEASPSTPRGPTRTPTVRSALPSSSTSAVHGATDTTRPTRPCAATTVRSTSTPSRDPA